ncbi:SNF1-interacting protein [Aspergillus terreus]
MGNSQTKESRPAASHRRSHGGAGRSPYSERHHSEGSRSRGSRPDLSILGIGGSHHERDVATLEHRRETRQEREARKLEKERIARVKERERSMREEHVDGGYLVTQGVYTGTEDFNKAIVRQLMIERRLAPFWRGLNDFSESWTEHQLMAAARGLPIPPPDEIPPELEYTNPPKATDDSKESADSKMIQHLTVPITSRSQSYGSDASQSSNPTNSLPSPASPIASGTSSSPLFRTRAKTLASLTTSKHNQVDPGPREMQLPRDPFVNGQPIEAYLYKEASECPICFLYYPPYLNRTRCCDQPICSECFVQIKRPDPHPPEHGDADSNAPAESQEGERPENQDGQLVMEPAACPFCVQPEFGVTYAPPPFRRGLTYALDPNSRPNFTSPVSSTSSLASANPATVPGRRRATSLSASDPLVITTDRIRPDWAQKLANARAHAARRSAAATALHTAAYLMNSNPTGDSRNFSLGRRGVMRRSGAVEGGNSSSRTGSPALQALAFLTDRRPAGTDTDSAEEQGNLAPPRQSSRRNRIDDLEEMMMMEAIRLSLASEEERRKREEKEAKKDAKKREKEAKKAEKAARKTGMYSNNASGSALDVPSELGRVVSSSSSITGEEATPAGKGKEVDRVSPNAPAENDPGAAGASDAVQVPGLNSTEQHHSAPLSSAQPTSRPSHLRNVSSASSFSSLVESMSEDHPGAAEGTSSSPEPLYNFRSLAAVIGDDEKPEEAAEHVEDTLSQKAEGSGTQSVSPATDSALGGTAEIPCVTVEGDRDCLIPKELETRSVELTGATRNAEATS